MLIQKSANPLRVLSGSALQPESARLHWHQPKGQTLRGLGIKLQEIHQDQVAAKCLILGNTLVIVDKVATAVENRPVFEKLDCFHVMRRMTVEHIEAPFNQAMRETNLIAGNLITPVWAPMN